MRKSSGIWLKTSRKAQSLLQVSKLMERDGRGGHGILNRDLDFTFQFF